MSGIGFPDPSGPQPPRKGSLWPLVVAGLILVGMVAAVIAVVVLNNDDEEPATAEVTAATFGPTTAPNAGPFTVRGRVKFLGGGADHCEDASAVLFTFTKGVDDAPSVDSEDAKGEIVGADCVVTFTFVDVPLTDSYLLGVKGNSVDLTRADVQRGSIEMTFQDPTP